MSFSSFSLGMGIPSDSSRISKSDFSSLPSSKKNFDELFKLQLDIESNPNSVRKDPYVEYGDFYKQINRYIQSPNPDLGSSIVSRFFKHGASDQVFLSSEVSKQLLPMFEHGEMEMSVIKKSLNELGLV